MNLHEVILVKYIKNREAKKLKYDGGLRRKETSKRITTARSFDSYKKYLFPIKKKTKKG